MAAALRPPPPNVEDLVLGGGTTLGSFNPFHAEYRIPGLTGVIKKFDEYLDHLMKNPAELDYIAKEAVLMLQINVSESSTLEIIAGKIVGKAITTANLAYTGARLCYEMIASGLAAEGQEFEDILLTCCNKRFRKLVQQYKFGDDKTQALEDIRGFTRFFSELYLKLTIEKSENAEAYNVIGSLVEELLKYFCMAKTDENILFIAQILRLVGWQLDNANDEKGAWGLKRTLDAIFMTLKNANACPDISSASRATIEDLEELRARGWDHIEDRRSLEVEVSNSETPPESQNQKIYELPYDYYMECLSYYNFEERDEEGIYLEDEPEEVGAAYDEFLAEVNEKRRIERFRANPCPPITYVRSGNANANQ